MNPTKRSLRRRSALPLAFGALSILACSPSQSPQPSPGNVQQTLNDAPDGNRTITTAGTVVNTYAQLTADVAANATSLTVDSTQLTAMGLAAGDLIMILQPQGAAIGTADDNTYGTIGTLNGAGRFEFIGVKAVNTGTGVVSLDTLCNGLKNAYTVAGKSQIVRVPQYADLSVSASGTIVPAAWDGATGGVVAVRARHLTVGANASVNASASGFRGGQTAMAGTAGTDTTKAPPSDSNSLGSNASRMALRTSSSTSGSAKPPTRISASASGSSRAGSWDCSAATHSPSALMP